MTTKMNMERRSESFRQSPMFDYFNTYVSGMTIVSEIRRSDNQRRSESFRQSPMFDYFNTYVSGMTIVSEIRRSDNQRRSESFRQSPMFDYFNTYVSGMMIVSEIRRSDNQRRSESFRQSPMFDYFNTYVSGMMIVSEIRRSDNQRRSESFRQSPMFDYFNTYVSGMTIVSEIRSQNSPVACLSPTKNVCATRKQLPLDVTNAHIDRSQTTLTRHNQSKLTPKRSSQSSLISTNKYIRRLLSPSSSLLIDSPLSSCFTKRRSCSPSRSPLESSSVEESTDDQRLSHVKADSLPTINGKVADVNSITAKTMVDVLSGRLRVNADVTIVDCRYPYEYDGGHITGAINLFTKEKVTEHFFTLTGFVPDRHHVIIFHCEFSSERGPNIYRHLRQHDRHVNAHRYPHLSYPHIYLLDSGYSSFYHENKTLCIPDGYTSMFHRDHKQDLKKFRIKSKSYPVAKSCRQDHSDVRIALNF